VLLCEVEWVGALYGRFALNGTKKKWIAYAESGESIVGDQFGY